VSYLSGLTPIDHMTTLVEPSFAEWSHITQINMNRLSLADRLVAGRPIFELRQLAVEEAWTQSLEFGRRLGLPIRPARSARPSRPIVVTGHQPTLYGPGVWFKVFQLQRHIDATGGTGFNLVVDSDIRDALVSLPAVEGPYKSVVPLASSSGIRYMAATPVPQSEQIDSFSDDVLTILSGLGHAGLSQNFLRFRSALTAPEIQARNISEFMTFARRRVEAEVGHDYLELPVSRWASMSSFNHFAADIIMRILEFAGIHNSVLEHHRKKHKIRSGARPFNDLVIGDGFCELPFWLLDGRSRHRIFARVSPSGIELSSATGQIVSTQANVAALVDCLGSVVLAPKALTLTMFARLFIADLFIHGIGGARYDQVTDAVIDRFYGVTPPSFATVSITAYPPFAVDMDEDKERISVLEKHLGRMRHHPERFIADARAVSIGSYETARELIAEKACLIATISDVGADKVAKSRRIRYINQELNRLLHPETRIMTEEMTRLRRRLERAAVLNDREFPFCFWDPKEFCEQLTGGIW